ncbi:AAA family ATPase [Lactobacillus delbrueckii]|uniref:AAA family ATPase n=1 Tax=Lactobacillus delbrueckii TaxID=1584 RepID=UPI0011C7670E|nr:AAA family ATPase [Lactobacillus delbrueckii]TXG06000.1 EVE domain-containing protein [Lactobacillus delbrueckii subsp. bulgaricus]
MLDKIRFDDLVEEYQKDFEYRIHSDHSLWLAIACFQNNWSLDDQDFESMFADAVQNLGNILNLNTFTFDSDALLELIERSPKIVHAMMVDLFDENQDTVIRIKNFKQQANELLDGDYALDEETVSMLLCLNSPDKYGAFNLRGCQRLASWFKLDYEFEQQATVKNLQNWVVVSQEIIERLSDNQLLLDEYMYYLEWGTEKEPNYLCDKFGNDFQWSAEKDSQLLVLASDICNYLTQHRNLTPTIGQKQYWWLNANPRFWNLSDLKVGEERYYTLYSESGHKRRVFQHFLDAKVGDKIIGYESYPSRNVVALMEISRASDGEAVFFKKIEKFEHPVAYKDLRQCPELKDLEVFISPTGSLFKVTEDEFNFIMDKVREHNPVAYTKENFLSEVYMPEADYDRVSALLKYKKNIILQGAPGVGKTFAAKRLAYAMMGQKKDENIELIQFHQSYTYEDFMMGYKPTEQGFELRYGSFYRFCKRAAEHPDEPFFCIIDEINRGNLSKIFGELLMLLERDYRDQPITLAYTDEPFAVPSNVYLIGMMNTADRSLSIIDYALRRRFSFFDMKPAFESTGFMKRQLIAGNVIFDRLINRIEELNDEISRDSSLGLCFCIGHSYFGNPYGEWTRNELRLIVDYDILPMLREYWFDDQDKREYWESALHEVLND